LILEIDIIVFDYSNVQNNWPSKKANTATTLQ